MSEVNRVPCPHCSFQIDPVVMARTLPGEVLIAERARRNALKRQPIAGPGRPKGIARCPSCPGIFPLVEIRKPLIPCLTVKLQDFKSADQKVRVAPMDNAQERDFLLRDIGNEIVTLFKLSNTQRVDIPLRAIRKISSAVNGELPVITLRGALRWL